MARATTKTKEPDMLVQAGVVEQAPQPSPIARAASPKAESRAVAVHQPSTSHRSLLQVCLDAATRRGVTPEKVKAYLDMAHEEEARKLELEFNNLMIDARAEMPDIVKDAWNPHTKSHYAKLENISKQIDSIARRYGFQHTYGMADAKLDNHYRVIVDLMNRNGFTRRYYAEIGSDTAGAKGGGTKSGAQGSGSSIAYARRYLKMMVWDLAVAGEDNDAGARADKDGTISAEQVRKLDDLIRETRTNLTAFCDHYHIEGLPHLPKAAFKGALALLERKQEGES